MIKSTIISTLFAVIAISLTNCTPQIVSAPPLRTIESKTYELNGRSFVQDRTILTDRPRVETQVRTRELR